MVSVYQTPVDTAKCHLCVCVCVWGVWVSDVSRHCQMSPVCVCVCMCVCVCVGVSDVSRTLSVMTNNLSLDIAKSHLGGGCVCV